MNRAFALSTAALSAIGLLAFAAGTPLRAELALGAKAPDFTTQGALAGKTFSFHLADALKKGPVVLYFYPKSFTKGCTLEAHAFADATAEFEAAGATVIGLSHDDLATQQKFSSAECRDKFPVGVATPAIIDAYKVSLIMGMSKRASYVIAPDGHVTMVYSDLDYRDHVKRTLAAVQALMVKKA